MTNNPDTTKLPWYRKELGPRLKPNMRKLFDEYSKVPSEEVEDHLYEFVSSIPSLSPLLSYLNCCFTSVLISVFDLDKILNMSNI